jgi:hypothetical protein
VWKTKFLLPHTTSWAYLSAGFLLLFVADYVANTDLLNRESWTVVQGIVAISAAYAVGYLAASVSSFTLERILVRKLLGYPTDVLFGKFKACAWIRFCLPGYFKPLPNHTQQAALNRGRDEGVNTHGEALFYAAHAYARVTPPVMSRLDNFLNLYGFCRNTATVAIIDSAMLYWSYRFNGGPEENLYWSWVALLMGLGITLRYLKFFRHYSVEVFTAYAYNKAV